MLGGVSQGWRIRACGREGAGGDEGFQGSLVADVSGIGAGGAGFGNGALVVLK